MVKNVGSADKWIRYIIGLVLILWASLGLSGTAMWVVIIIGLIPIVTAMMGWCPIYFLFKVSTKKEG